MTLHDVERDVVLARSLTLLAGMAGVQFNGQPVIEGPSLVPGEGGVEYVLIRTGTIPTDWQQYLIAADTKIALHTMAR